MSLGAVLLLPMTILSNEILVCYPGSYYVKWLNVSLIQGKLYMAPLCSIDLLFSDVGLWNHVFLGSNACLFILIPFAYFFSEAEGFSGTRKVC